MFTVGFDALAWFFLRVRRSSRLAMRWFSNCTSELWQRWRHCNLSAGYGFPRWVGCVTGFKS